MRKFLELILLTLAFLVAGVAAATTLADPAGAATLPAMTAAQPGCQPVLDLGKLASAKGETCPATAAPRTKTPEPEFMAGGRTCRCSCGFPCTSDADCGGALGSCRAGITCC
jgi:hypothetical protein